MVMASGQNKILIVEDDAEICALVEHYLTGAAFSAVIVNTGADMKDVLSVQDFDAIILDLNLPDADGLDLCRYIRAERDIPIVILTARGDPIDRIVGLELGADDYLAKPFEPRELVARLKSVLRRSARSETTSAHGDAQYMFEGWSMSVDHRALIDPSGRMVALSGVEYRLLKIFLDHPNEVLSREKLLELGAGAFGAEHDRAVDLQVSRLRTKLKNGNSGEGFIKTVRQAGYRFNADVKSLP